MPVNPLEHWVESATKRIHELQQKHGMERLQLEVEIESHPELVRMEERALLEGDAKTRSSLSARLEAKMKEEVIAALRYIVDLHRRKRQPVFQAHANERRRLGDTLRRESERLQKGMGTQATRVIRLTIESEEESKSEHEAETSEELDRVCARFGMALSSSLTAPKDWAKMEAGHRMQISEHWAQGEHVNLQVAFQHQLDRVDSEWTSYCDAMHREYCQERAKLQGVAVDQVRAEVEKELGHAGCLPMAPTPESKTGHWLEKEKQETLVHTAPVLSPSAMAAEGFDTLGKSPLSSRSRKTGPRLHCRDRAGQPSTSHVKKSIAILQSNFLNARSKAIRQWKMARQWILRQKLRMLLQVDAQEIERRDIVEHMKRETAGFESLVSFVNDFKASLKPSETIIGPSPIKTCSFQDKWKAEKAFYSTASESVDSSTSLSTSRTSDPSTPTDSSVDDTLTKGSIEDLKKSRESRKFRRGGPHLRAADAAKSTDALRA